MLPEISARRSLLDPSFRYLSPGREGEKCRPLDHARQIPFIHSDRFLIQSNFSTYRKVYQLFHPSGTHNWVYMTIAHVPLSENANWVPAQFPMKKRRERKKSFFTTRKSSHFSYTRFFFFRSALCTEQLLWTSRVVFAWFWHWSSAPKWATFYHFALL